MPWEIYCHQMNFKFWNHNRFETWVIDFVEHGLSAAFYLFPDTANWYHGLLWQLKIHLHTTDKSSLMLSHRMDIFFFRFIHAVSIRALTHFLKLKRAVIETLGLKRKTFIHTPSVETDWSDSMEMIGQLAKKTVIRICHVLKQNKGWHIADSPCPTKSMTLYQIDYDSKTWNSFYDNKVFRIYAGLVRLYNAINLITLFPSVLTEIKGWV